MPTDNFNTTNSEKAYAEATNAEAKIDKTLTGLFTFLNVVVVLILATILVSFWIKVNFAKALSVFASFLSIGGAYLLAGGIIGFLFAIPRSGTYRYKPGQNSESWYDDNTNLEEISDWLTKIIVGLTLVQFNKILQLLDTSARSISMAFSANCTYDCAFYPWAYAAIVFFMACGFVIAYLWTRINFALILTLSRKNLNDISNLEKKVSILEKIKDEKLSEISTIETKKEKSEEQLEKINDAVSSKASQENIRNADETAFVTDLNKYPEDLRERLTEMIEVARSKTIVVYDDLQKGRWGGQAVNNGKQLYAEVNKSDKVPGFFNVVIKVKPTDPAVFIGSPVAFFVHDSFGFPDNVVLADVDSSGEAKMSLLAYEAFTVGALCLDGTELELDLNQTKGYPVEFYWK